MILAAFIVVLDNTVLNVAIPTILREFHTTLPALEWVVTGYALTFATLLIIGGRLGDIYGHRRIFIIGAALFGVGSLIASLSHVGAQLDPRRGDHRGHRRVVDAAGDARDPLGHVPRPGAGDGVRGVGRDRGRRGRVRTGRRRVPHDQLLVALGVPHQRDHRAARHHRRAAVHEADAELRNARVKIDAPGAALIAVGMFLLVFALSEGGTYGWWEPLKDFTIAGHVVWPATRAVSIIPIMFVVSVVVLVGFYVVERAKERRRRDPLFEFSHLRLETYRYGLLTGLCSRWGSSA